MKKKVLYGVALTLFASVSVGSLQSCKDDLNDLATQTTFDLSNVQSKLQAQIDALKEDMAGKLNSADLAAKVAELQVIQDLVNRIKALEERPTGSTYDDTELRNLYAQLNGALSTLQGTVGGLEGSLSGLEGTVSSLSETLSQLQQNIDSKLDELNNKLESQDADMEELKNELQGQIDANKAAIDALQAYVEENYATKQEVEEVWLMIEQVQQQMTQMYNLITEETDEKIAEVYTAVKQKIAEVQNAINAIVNQLDNQVTGILIQGVNSPVFGDFRTPLGIQSNILFNWYGYNKHDVTLKFPSNDGEGFSATGTPNLPLASLNPTYFSAPGGYYGDTETNEVTLGKVYVTLNPVGAKFNNLEVSLETSAGNALPYKVALNPSDYELMHGYTRSEANGFYEGELKMPLNAENIKQIEVAMEEDLKTSLKDIVKDPSKTTAKALVSAVFQQLQGKVPAYALRYDWTTGQVPSLTEENMDPGFSQNSWAVLSQYDLAVATALPLSYNTFEGVHGSTKLPEIPHIQNFINKLKEIGNFTIDMGEFTVKGVKIDLGEISFEGVDTDLTFTLKNVKVTYADGSTQTIQSSDPVVIKGSESGMDDMLEDIKKAINETLEKAGKDVTEQLDEMTADIEKQVNDMMAKINDQIGGKINDMIGSIENKLEPYYGKINAAIDLFNKIANKINNFIEDPNAYMQVAAFYKMGSSDYGIVSGVATDPTPFYGNGEAFSLFLSSYTGELIVPACKKYVAVTSVKGDDTRSIAEINSALGADFNKVLDGNRIRVAVKASELKKNNVYEFSYQALDYRGYTSTKKFYIEVK